MAIKSIPKDKVEILIKHLEEELKNIDEKASGGSTQHICTALGMAEAILEITVKKLKGEYSILMPFSAKH